MRREVEHHARRHIAASKPFEHAVDGRERLQLVPHLRVLPTPCLNAGNEGAVMSTPCEPPPVAFFAAAAGSPFFVLIITSASWNA